MLLPVAYLLGLLIWGVLAVLPSTAYVFIARASAPRGVKVAVKFYWFAFLGAEVAAGALLAVQPLLGREQLAFNALLIDLLVLNFAGVAELVGFRIS